MSTASTPNTDPTVIVAGARTPMGRMSGSLKGFSGSDLGGFAIKGALEKSGVKPEDVDYVIMGQVLTAGEGQIPARQAAVKAGIPMSVPALTVNKVCLSGLDAIALADQARARGRVRRRRRRWPGVDDQRAAPAAQEPRRLQVRRRHSSGLDGLRRPLRHPHESGDGLAHRGQQRRRERLHPRGAGRLRRPQPPERRQGLEGRLLRRRGRPRLDPAAQG